MAFKPHFPYMNTLENYLESGYKMIDGWLLRSAVEATLHLGKILDDFSINGPVCEIGIWQGRYLALLSFLTGEGYSVVGIDPFLHCPDPQKQKTTLLANMQSYMHIPGSLKIIEKDSKHINQSEILSASGEKFKFLSIDGDHTQAGCLNDLKLAENLLKPGGILAVDDISNLSCPGVIEAVIYHSNQIGSNLAPFLAVGNKLFMTQKDFYKIYRDEIIHRATNNDFGSIGKEILDYHLLMQSLNIPVSFLNHEILIYPEKIKDDTMITFNNKAPDQFSGIRGGIISKLLQVPFVKTHRVQKGFIEDPDLYNSFLKEVVGKRLATRQGKLGIFGAGTHTEIAIKAIPGLHKKIHCITDNNSNLWNQNKFEVPILPPQEAVKVCDFFFLSTTLYQRIFKKKLRQLKFKGPIISVDDQVPPTWFMG